MGARIPRRLPETCATVAGADHFVEVSLWGAEPDVPAAVLPFPHGIPARTSCER
jgi:hypothetical protein